MKTGLKTILIALFSFLLLLIVIYIISTRQNERFHGSQVIEKMPGFTIKKSIGENPNISAKAGLVRFVSEDGNYEQNLFATNDTKPMLIASITKLMTALVAEENINKNEVLIFPNSIINDKGSSGDFKINEKWTYEELLYLMLIDSNNDSAEVLASSYDRKKFINLMNTKADEIGMVQTKFINESGLDDVPTGNISTIDDLLKLILYLNNKHPKIISITGLADYVAEDTKKEQEVAVVNTNSLLKSSSFPLKILGGKTGETPKAKRNLILLTEAPNNKGYLIFAVLQSEDNFADITKLANWSVESFEWN